jgi:hypothetical protein
VIGSRAGQGPRWRQTGRVDWAPVFARYVWAVAAREALGSRRWSGETKALVVVTLGPAVAVLTLGLELWWVVTGRGRWLRHMLAQDVVVANPFPKRMPAGFVEQLAEMRADQSSKSCKVKPRHNRGGDADRVRSL